MTYETHFSEISPLLGTISGYQSPDPQNIVNYALVMYRIHGSSDIGERVGGSDLADEVIEI